MEHKKIETSSANDKTKVVRALLLLGLCATANARSSAIRAITQADVASCDRLLSASNETKSGLKGQHKTSADHHSHRGDVSSWKKKNR